MRFGCVVDSDRAADSGSVCNRAARDADTLGMTAPDNPSLASKRREILPYVLACVTMAVTVLTLHLMGRIWWCACGQRFLWTGDIWSEHCSQHLVDPYLFSHISHGFWFYGLIMWLPLRYTRPSLGWALCIATIIECAWEVLENSPIIINRYRAVTISIGYTGDSVINSGMDIVACACGVFIARALGFAKTLALFVAFELGTLLWVRDNLTLNVLMLIWPIDAIRQWQSAIAG